MTTSRTTRRTRTALATLAAAALAAVAGGGVAIGQEVVSGICGRTQKVQDS